MWRIYFFVSVFFFGCSNGDTKTSNEKDASEDTPAEQTDESDSNNTITENKVAKASPAFKNACAKIVAAISGLSIDSFATCNKNTAHLFSLNDNNAVFSANQIAIIKNAETAAVMFHKKDTNVEIEEWAFADAAAAINIENALTAPLPDKTQERFLRAPFTFWRIQNKLYHLRATSEKSRELLNKINEILTQELSPEYQ